MLSLLSWNPSRVSTRNADCDRLHALYIQLGLPKERITAQVHYFLCHYQSRLEWHGNLQGLNTEGGEHCHGHNKEFVMCRPSTPHWKCPIGIEIGVEDSALGLALWAEGHQVPSTGCDHTITVGLSQPQPPAHPLHFS